MIHLKKPDVLRGRSDAELDALAAFALAEDAGSTHGKRPADETAGCFWTSRSPISFMEHLEKPWYFLIHLLKKSFLLLQLIRFHQCFIHQSAYLLSSELIKDCKALPAVDCIAVPLGTLVAGSLKNLPQKRWLWGRSYHDFYNLFWVGSRKKMVVKSVGDVLWTQQCLSHQPPETCRPTECKLDHISASWSNDSYMQNTNTRCIENI